MSLQPQKLPEIPEETARIAKILFPKGNKYMWLRDELDATYKEAAIRQTNRFVCAIETLRAALNSLAVIVPDWLRAHVPQDWYDRYGKRTEDFHLPKEASKFVPLIEQIGCDGFELMRMGK